MQKIVLPISSKKRQKVVERIIGQLLSKTDLIYPKEIKGRHVLLSHIISGLKTNKNIRSKVQTKWGYIEDPIELLESFKGQDWELKGVKKHFRNYNPKELARAFRRKFPELVNLIDKIIENFPLEERDYSSIDEFIQQLTYLPQVEEISYLDPLTGTLETFSIDTTIAQLQAIDSFWHSSFLSTLSKKLRKMKNSWETAMRLEQELNEYGAKYDIECYMIDWEYMEYLGYGIKIQIGPGVYLFHFQGTYDELKELLQEEIQAHAKDTVNCPFCGVDFRRETIRDMTECTCGALIQNEIVREVGSNWSRDLEYLWDEACSSLGISKPKNYRKIYIDDYFSNIVYLGTGNVGWKTWTYTLPWKRKVKKSNEVY